MSTQTCPESRRSPLEIQILAHHPLAGQYLVNMLSAHRNVVARLAKPPTSDFDFLQGDTSPRLFILDTYFLKTELSKVCRHLRSCRPGSRFVGLLPARGCEDGDILRMLYVGLEGLVKISEGLEQELVSAVNTVLAGELWAPRRVLAEYVRQTNWWRSDQLLSQFSLTPRESQVLQLTLRCLSNKEIAGILGISERTVKFHLSNIFGKLRVDDRHTLPAAIGITLGEPSSPKSALVRLTHAIA